METNPNLIEPISQNRSYANIIIFYQLLLLYIYRHKSVGSVKAKARDMRQMNCGVAVATVGVLTEELVRYQVPPNTNLASWITLVLIRGWLHWMRNGKVFSSP